MRVKYLPILAVSVLPINQVEEHDVYSLPEGLYSAENPAEMPC